VLRPSFNGEVKRTEERGSLTKEEPGFSNFGHFKPPIKRPSCNPIVKDERFKSLNENNNLTCNFEFQDQNVYAQDK
jgi:hypothetical protein